MPFGIYMCFQVYLLISSILVLSGICIDPTFFLFFFLLSFFLSSFLSLDTESINSDVISGVVGGLILN